ncbi:MAG TPA: Ig-like domain-containing protein [Gemmatimonadales bacterium]|nr:Ig-like domain-containing protein [Gemmatimonadales bacterium]
MRSFAALRHVGAVLIAGLIGSACSDNCPNCPGSPATVVISPGTSSVLLDRELQLVALVYDKNGNLLSGHTATWSSNDDNVATVDAGGKVSGVAVGTATITANIAGQDGNGTVEVVTTSTLSAQVQPILQSSCALAFCHVTPGPPPTMTSAAVTYASLVTSGNYLVPGDTTTGLLLQRLHGIPTPMPPDAPLVQLQPGNYDLIALWIQEGALNN